MIEQLGQEDINKRNLLLARIANLAEWPAVVPDLEGDLVVFVAADAREIPDAELERFSEKLLEQRTAYLCAWGPDCHRVHDAFDAVRDRAGNLPDDDSVVMTTWHDDETLDEALWFALYTACPHDRYIETCTATLCIVVGRDDWGGQVRAALEDPAALTARVLD